MIEALKYHTLERINVHRPVERVGFIADLCRDKIVLDIGCLDETAYTKHETADWLHARIALKATKVTGVDSSEQLPKEGLRTSPNSYIFRGDGVHPDASLFEADMPEIIVAGEFIEHLENPLEFLRSMKALFPGRELVLSTPNGASYANALLAMISSEAQHPDHLMTSTYKTLNTLCKRSGVATWRILPYRFYATEMLLVSPPLKRAAVKMVETFIRAVEWLFPLRGFGYVVHIKL